MKLSYLSQTWFPFLVPEKDATFASSVGPQTVYPVGYTLDKALQIYWRAKDYRLIATGGGTLSGVTQALTINQLLPPRNASVGTNTFFELDGIEMVGPGDLVPGVGLIETIPGTGTITADAGTNPDALFNLQVFLFYPEVFAPDPVVKYDGKWWPAMSISCAVSNTVSLSGGGELEIAYSCDSFDPGSTTEIGDFSFFGESVPIFCAALGSGETRSCSGSLAVESEWA